MPLTAETVEALRHANVRDPFAVLGLQREAGGIWARVWMRGVRFVRIMPRDGGGTPVELTARADGLFEGRIPWASQLFAYELAVHADGESVERRVRDPYSFWPQLGDLDLDLIRAGRHLHLGDVLGAHVKTVDGVEGVRFAVWAPTAARVSVVGDWNGFDGRWHPMRHRGPSGVWELFIPGVKPGMLYKYEILSATGEVRIKADPCAWAAEKPPATASVVSEPDRYAWGDAGWMEARRTRDHMARPMATYEVHLGSWQRGPEPGDTWPNYRKLADRLIAHCKRFGFTHLELLPVAQHPYEGSWGYQVTGQFAPNSRHGSPDDLRVFVDRCHQAGISVIVDFVPGHFPKDDFALARFDGGACYEYEDPREGEHKTWGTCVFNFRRPEVRNFLIAAALHWLRRYHIDALRVDAVSSMLYRNYDRTDGEWVPNEQGGAGNLEAVSFLQELTSTVHRDCAGVLMIAEESTAWPGVTAPTELKGLGFDLKWNMGWMHDMFQYFAKDSVFRKYHQQLITFSMLYAFTENFTLPVSHDEVVYGKRSLIYKMPGDEWQRFANTRAFLAYMFAHPGKKLLFMGCEFGQTAEWNHDTQLEWRLLQYPIHYKLQTMVKELNWLYRREAALFEVDDSYQGFEWIDLQDSESSIITFIRFARNREDFIVFACNFTPVPREGYRIGVPKTGLYRELFNTDSELFGGANVGNAGAVWADEIAFHGRPASLNVTIPPLAVVAFKL